MMNCTSCSGYSEGENEGCARGRRWSSLTRFRTLELLKLLTASVLMGLILSSSDKDPFVTESTRPAYCSGATVSGRYERMMRNTVSDCRQSCLMETRARRELISDSEAKCAARSMQ